MVAMAVHLHSVFFVLEGNLKLRWTWGGSGNCKKESVLVPVAWKGRWKGSKFHNQASRLSHGYLYITNVWLWNWMYYTCFGRGIGGVAILEARLGTVICVFSSLPFNPTVIIRVSWAYFLMSYRNLDSWQYRGCQKTTLLKAVFLECL